MSLGAWCVETLARVRRERVLRHVRGRLLDIGCGDNRLVRTHGEGVGVDILNWGDVDLVCDAARLPYPDASFDTVSFVASLNHIPNREAVLVEARRLLRPDGTLLATMIPPGISKIWHRLVQRYDPDQHGRTHQEGEVWGIDDAEMRRLLERSGFRIVRRERFDLHLNSLYVAVPEAEQVSTCASPSSPSP